MSPDEVWEEQTHVGAGRVELGQQSASALLGLAGKCTRVLALAFRTPSRACPLPVPEPPMPTSCQLAGLECYGHPALPKNYPVCCHGSSSTRPITQDFRPEEAGPRVPVCSPHPRVLPRQEQGRGGSVTVGVGCSALSLGPSRVWDGCFLCDVDEVAVGGQHL